MPQQPWADVPDARRAVMRANKAKNTKPEIVVRRMLHAMGYRFRLHRRDLPGTPDIVFPGRRKAIQVHGCFWHQHEGCRRATLPATRREFWVPKLARNKQRDADAEARLRALGWKVINVWECELQDLGRLEAKLQSFLAVANDEL
ncbi:DNA mismatch endonuclease Vsr [Roseomonas sp. SG15]|uniref:Very short patch repair endonuclease n=1 Tax=Roseomonas indoligenes TaxID=2820811 RepID=A0A940N161_9PROT|nr:very short patch repair endonuclease [Pararoseomonas indoligenes]MBP0496011.1 DNA mismatch endonuclease Vsr [Pararoseomonas indoligenes]